MDANSLNQAIERVEHARALLAALDFYLSKTEPKDSGFVLVARHGHKLLDEALAECRQAAATGRIPDLPA